MTTLSKSKLLAYRQCPKRLWLEIHRPTLREDSATTQVGFQAGDDVGQVARRVYDPQGLGSLIDPHSEGWSAAFARTQSLLRNPQPIFEAAFSTGDALALADVLLPDAQGNWRMVEVKSSTSVKDYHLDDVAIQAHVARTAGVPLKAVALAHINSAFIYAGNGDYAGLFREEDLTVSAFSHSDEVRGWIQEAQRIAAGADEPEIAIGGHCDTPYACGFYAYCSATSAKAEHPIDWLPRRSAALNNHIATHELLEIQDVPNELLNEKQLRVKQATLSGATWFDREGAAQAVSKLMQGLGDSLYFLDFETIAFAVPIWAGTRPYQQIPFQFSVHLLSADGKLTQDAFLDLSGANPSQPCAEKLISICAEPGPIFAYNAGFERSRIRDLAERLPHLRTDLLSINERIVDLLPVAREHYYHPSQHGSWSIKAVLPAMFPNDPALSYQALDGVQDGGGAQTAYLEAIHPKTPPGRKAQLQQQLLAYCKLDTLAMVKLWAEFTHYRLKD